jgi:putative tryptophan/tyrosine transport system substrate-binding protein
MNPALVGKRLGLLQELVPAVTRFALLIYLSNQAASVIAEAEAAPSAIGRQISVFGAATNREIDVAFEDMVKTHVEAVLIGPGPLFSNRRVQIAILAARHGLPTVHFDGVFVEAGGLMSYGPSIADTVRLGGTYVGRVVKGEKPADQPVLQPTRFELVLNVQTARTLGIAVPATLLARADEVIE